MENISTPPAHTPTPWHVNVAPSGTICIDHEEIHLAYLDASAVISPAEEAANATFIVRACNAYEELIAALRDALVVLDLAAHRDPGQAGVYHCPLARHAIAKAESR
jgi:hypothetical protein